MIERRFINKNVTQNLFQCWECQKPESQVAGRLRTCTKCKVARYCNKKCQEDDWRVHKLIHKGHKETAKAIAKMRRCLE